MNKRCMRIDVRAGKQPGKQSERTLERRLVQRANFINQSDRLSLNHSLNILEKSYFPRHFYLTFCQFSDKNAFMYYNRSKAGT